MNFPAALINKAVPFLEGRAQPVSHSDPNAAAPTRLRLCHSSTPDKSCSPDQAPSNPVGFDAANTSAIVGDFFGAISAPIAVIPATMKSASTHLKSAVMPGISQIELA
jgi:hypothetical protein